MSSPQNMVAGGPTVFAERFTDVEIRGASPG